MVDQVVQEDQVEPQALVVQEVQVAQVVQVVPQALVDLEVQVVPVALAVQVIDLHLLQLVDLVVQD